MGENTVTNAIDQILVIPNPPGTGRKYQNNTFKINATMTLKIIFKIVGLKFIYIYIYNSKNRFINLIVHPILVSLK